MKYNALRLIANINKIFGYVIVLVGIISIFPALNIYFTGYDNGGFLQLIFIPVGILCLGLIFVASGEIIYVLIDIEETNQSSTRYLEKVLAMMKSEIESRNVKIHEPRRNSKIADELISATQKVELNTDNEIQTNSSEDFNDAYKYLIENNYSVRKNTSDRVPRLKYTISKENFLDQIKYSDMELVNFVEKLKQNQS